MFDWTEQRINKGRLQALLIEFEPSGNMPEEPEEGLKANVCYQVGYMDGSDFVIVKNRNLHFRQVGIIAIVEAIQATSTQAEAKAAIEALLIAALDNASPE